MPEATWHPSRSLVPLSPTLRCLCLPVEWGLGSHHLRIWNFTEESETDSPPYTETLVPFAATQIPFSWQLTLLSPVH